jgi:hypothetical protein
VFPQIKVLAGHRFEPALAWRSNLRNPFHQEVLDDPAAQQVATQPPKLQVATCGSGTGTSWNDAGLFGRIGGMATDDAPIRAGSLRLLAGNPPFRLLWSARAVSYLGDSLGLVALMLHVADATGRALAVALLLLVGDFAPALLGPLAGTLVDRLDRKRVMVGCELVQGFWWQRPRSGCRRCLGCWSWCGCGRWPDRCSSRGRGPLSPPWCPTPTWSAPTPRSASRPTAVRRSAR